MTDYLSVTACPLRWGEIREMASMLGLQCEESRGFLSRSFTLRGEAQALRKAALSIQKLIKEDQAWLAALRKSL